MTLLAEWNLDEASGNVIDTVASLSLPKIGAGSVGYETSTAQTSPVDVTDYSPGVTSEIDSGFGTTAAQSGLDIAIETDFNIFWVAKLDSLATGTNPVVFSTLDYSNYTGIEVRHYNGPTFGRMRMYAYKTQWVVNSFTWNTGTTNSVPGDGDYHIYEIRAQHSLTGGSCTLYIDGVSQGNDAGWANTFDEVLAASGAAIGCRPAGTNGYNGDILYARMADSLIYTPPAGGAVIPANSLMMMGMGI